MFFQRSEAEDMPPGRMRKFIQWFCRISGVFHRLKTALGTMAEAGENGRRKKLYKI